MIHETRTALDARTQTAPMVITTVPVRPAGVAIVEGTAVGSMTRTRTVNTQRTRLIGSVSTAPARKPGRLVAIVAAGAVADVAILGTAGYLIGQTALAAHIVSGVLTLAAVLGVLLLFAVSSGTVHCPGCPR